MLSHDMRNIAAALELGADTGHLTGADLREISSRLANLAGVAQQLERTAVVALGGDRATDLPPNVIAIARKLDRKGVTVGLPVDPNGGDAA